MEIESQNLCQRYINHENLFNLIKSKSGNDNFIFSPLSIYIALGMLAEGLEDEARNQLVSVFGYHPKAIIGPKKILAITKNLNEVNEKYNFAITNSNSIWFEKGLKIKKAYSKLLKEKYHSTAKSVDFSSPDTKKAINSWIEENTGGLIKDFVQEIDPSTIIMLFNTIYMKARWFKQFKVAQTKKDIFTNADETKVEVDFMTQTFTPGYISTKTHHYLRLNYFGIKAFMFIAFKREGVDDSVQPDFAKIANARDTNWNTD